MSHCLNYDNYDDCLRQNNKQRRTAQVDYHSDHLLDNDNISYNNKTTMVSSAVASNPTSSASSRRAFNIGGRRFVFNRENVIDYSVEICTKFVETIVLILGPILICFASTIILGLSYTFFYIYLPMMKMALVDASPIRKFIEIGGNVTFVVFILIEIIFNYFMCVTTSNTGPSYVKVVRELAESTNFDYPTSPQDLARFRRDFNDKMMLRMRRRQARDAERRQQQQHQHSSCCNDGNCSSNVAVATATTTTTTTTTTLNDDNNGSEKVTLRKTAKQQSNNATTTNGTVAPTQQIRSWMIMAPDEWGYCQKTNQPKPPRSHYDYVSKSLVMCMDHYCPWMFNAIGYFNYRYFVNFLIYVFIGMMYGVIICYRPFINSTSAFYRQQVAQYRKTGVWSHLHPYTPINSERMPLSLSFMLCLAVGLAVLCLGGFHLYLVLTGQTTIEFHANFVNKSKARRSGQKYRNPYDMGWKRNWQQVYGYRSSMVLSFLIPSTREPDYLPVPISGEEGKRMHLRETNSNNNNRSIEDGNVNDNDDDNSMQLQQTKPLLESSVPVNIV